MENVSRTLYIPLYGKALVSRRGLILRDPDAERIWASSGMTLKGKSASKWLAYNMGMRSAVFDSWLRQQLTENAAVLHLGCGLDSRCSRMECPNSWYDVDFPSVIEERRKHFAESDTYHMIGCDLREDFLKEIPAGGTAIVVMEGISMYLNSEERLDLLTRIRAHFDTVHLLMDVYTVFGARASKYKNPINDVGVTRVYGFDDPREMEAGTGLSFLEEQELTPANLIAQLPRAEQGFFKLMFAGTMAKKIYRLYEYRSI